MSTEDKNTAKVAVMEQQHTTAVQAKKQHITDTVLSALEQRCSEGLVLPNGYNPVNSLKQAQIALNLMQYEGRPILEVATNISVANCLMDTCMEGLDFTKNHCWFIPRKLKQPIKEVVNGIEVERTCELTLMEGIYGREAKMKRINSNYNAIVNFVKQGDEFEYSIDVKTGLTRIDKHVTKTENFDNDIIMAYTYTLDENNIQNVFIMSRKQWIQSWMASPNGAAVAKKFPEDFILRTIVKKATKHIVKSNVGKMWVNEESSESAIEDVQYEEVKENVKDIEETHAKPIAPPKATQPKTELFESESKDHTF